MTAPQIAGTRITVEYALEADESHTLAGTFGWLLAEIIPDRISVTQELVSDLTDSGLVVRVAGRMLSKPNDEPPIDTGRGFVYFHQHDIESAPDWLQELVKDARRAADAADRELVVNP